MRGLPTRPPGRAYGSSSSLPTCTLDSRTRWASGASASGHVAWITGRSSPAAKRGQTCSRTARPTSAFLCHGAGAQRGGGQREPPGHEIEEVHLRLRPRHHRDHHQAPLERQDREVAGKVRCTDHVEHDVDAASVRSVADGGDEVHLAVGSRRARPPAPRRRRTWRRSRRWRRPARRGGGRAGWRRCRRRSTPRAPEASRRPAGARGRRHWSRRCSTPRAAPPRRRGSPAPESGGTGARERGSTRRRHPRRRWRTPGRPPAPDRPRDRPRPPFPTARARAGPRRRAEADSAPRAA